MATKATPPNPEHRLLLSNLCLTYRLSPQTLHRTLAILMSPQLPPHANQQITTCLAALSISQKLHQVIPVSLTELAGEHTSVQAIVDTEIIIMRALGWRVAGEGLLEACLDVAEKWDGFVGGLQCIGARFYGQESACGFSCLLEACEKLVCLEQTSQFGRQRLALALVGLCIRMYFWEYKEQDERHRDRMGRHGKKYKEKLIKVSRSSNKSTVFIVEDFMQDHYGIKDMRELQEQVRYVKKHCFAFGLKDISTKMANIKVTSVKNLSSKRSQQSWLGQQKQKRAKVRRFRPQ